MSLSKRSSSKAHGSDFELQDFDDSLDNSVRGRLGRLVRNIAVNRSGLDIRAGSLQIYHQWIIKPTTGTYRLWSRFLVLWAVYSSLFTPFEFGFFRGLPRDLWVMDIVVQFVFFADIIITLFVGFEDAETFKFVTDFRSIAWRYAKKDLIPDFLACLPWDSIYKGTGRKEEVRFLVWVRLYRVRKVTGFLEALEKDIRINYFATRIAKLIFVELYCTHVAACLFYYLATTVSPAHEHDTWIGSLQLGDRSFEDFRHIDVGTRYVTSLYWAVLTMSTVGYGDIHAVNVREMLFLILFVSTDMILGAYLVGNMTALIVKGSNTERFRDRMTGLIKYMNRNSLDRDLKHQMVNHVRLQFETQLTDDSVIEDLPLLIRSKVAQQLYRDTVERVSLFRGCTSEFMSQIVSRVREEYFLPGEVVLEQRDAVDQLYIISYGLLEEVVVGDNGGEKVVAHLEQYSVFGEVGVLCNVPQPLTVRVAELSKLLRLDKQSFTNLLKIYFLDGRQIIANMLVGHESEHLLRQREADIKYVISKQDAELALMLIHAAFQGDVHHVRQLIKAGADPNRTDYDGRTALHLAASRGYDEIVVFLISQNADINAIGILPVAFPALKLSFTSQTLIHLGCNADNSGITPLLEALRGGHAVTAEALYEKGARLLLQEAGAFLCNVATTGDIEFLKRLLAYGADPNATDYDLRTPLHLAASEGLHLIVSVLVGAGANINAKDRWGCTPLDDARRTANGIVITILETYSNEGQRSASPAHQPGKDVVPDCIAAAAARKRQIEYLLERVRAGDSGSTWSSATEITGSPLVTSPKLGKKLTFQASHGRRSSSPVEIAECGLEAGELSNPTDTAANPDFVAGNRVGQRETSLSPMRVTIFPHHPWSIEKRTAGVVVWLPTTLDQLLEMAVEHFRGTRSFVLNSDGGEIRSLDLIANDDKLYIVGNLHFKDAVTKEDRSAELSVLGPQRASTSHR